MFGIGRRQITVRAVFIHHNGSINNLHRTDMARMGAAGQSAMYEKHVLVFQEAESAKELRFSFSGDFRNAWHEGQEGLLTYSGKRFVSFIPQ